MNGAVVNSAVVNGTVLLVEDERALADTLQLSLQKLKYQCTWARNLREAKKLLSQSRYTHWILDRNLPDGDGMTLLQEKAREDACVLILSAKSEVDERVKGLQAGADDYLSKPFSFAELSARLEALSRRRTNRAVAGDSGLWGLDADRLEVVAPTGKVQLTPLEFKFLSYLIEKEGTIISKNRLLKDVWGFTLLPKTRTIDYVMTQLRKRLETEPENPIHLLTVRGAGIKFVR